jgi:outer membrane protein assembly factor BamB
MNEFGLALALGASDVVVGAPFDDADGADAGAVWVFDRGTGALRFALDAPTARAGAHFGTAVAIAGDDAIVGAASEKTSGTVTAYSLKTGAVRWTRGAPASADGRLFGYAVAADARTIVVGAPCRDGTTDAGLALVLDRATGKTLRELAGPTRDACDFFGGAVALGAGVVVVGARHGGERDTGAVHVFAASTGRSLASFADGAGTAHVGWSVATRGARVLAGAAGSEGDVRVYRRARD